MVVCAANSRRAPPHSVGRGSFVQKLRLDGGCCFEPSLSFLSRPVARGARACALRHMENKPTAHRALVSARCMLGAVICAANSRRAPPHAVGRGSSAQTPRFVGGCGFEPSLPSRSRPVARGACALRPVDTCRPPTEHLSLRAACLARLSARPTRGGLHHTPLAEAPLRRHRALSAAAASNRRCRLALVSWRVARSRFVAWRTRRPPTEHFSLRAAACLARLSGPTRGALQPTSLAEALLHRHRATSAAAASNRRNLLFLVP